jgi:hypothetical protein
MTFFPPDPQPPPPVEGRRRDVRSLGRGMGVLISLKYLALSKIMLKTLREMEVMSSS